MMSAERDLGPVDRSTAQEQTTSPHDSQGNEARFLVLKIVLGSSVLGSILTLAGNYYLLEPYKATLPVAQERAKRSIAKYESLREEVAELRRRLLNFRVLYRRYEANAKVKSFQADVATDAASVGRQVGAVYRASSDPRINKGLASRIGDLLDELSERLQATQRNPVQGKQVLDFVDMRLDSAIDEIDSQIASEIDRLEDEIGK